jgi:hypothetical protein
MTKKKSIVLFVAIFALLILGLVAVYVYKNVNEKPPVVVDQSSASTQPSEPVAVVPNTIKSSMLQGVDAIHWAKGTVEVVKAADGAKLAFKDDFEVAQGPDLFVYLSPNLAGQELGEFASLGNLKATKGLQEYVLPENYQDYKTVVIWCRAFSVAFATADIQLNA